MLSNEYLKAFSNELRETTSPRVHHARAAALVSSCFAMPNTLSVLTYATLVVEILPSKTCLFVVLGISTFLWTCWFPSWHDALHTQLCC